jgi:hypothetical protein
VQPEREGRQWTEVSGQLYTSLPREDIKFNLNLNVLRDISSVAHAVQ